jgi:hypothetical protein
MLGVSQAKGMTIASFPAMFGMRAVCGRPHGGGVLVGRTIVFAAAIMTGLVASQAPEFAQQYRQRMGGAIDELQTVITHFDDDALRSGYEREAALTAMAGNDARIVRDQAAGMRRTIERHDRLVESQSEMQKAGDIGRMFALIRSADGDLAKATFDNFEPAVPTTAEALTIAGASFLGAYLFLHGLGYLVRPRRRRARSRKRRAAALIATREMMY